MDPRDFFRGFFGLPRDPRHFGGQFPPPPSEQEEDEECPNCRPDQQQRGEHFDVFTNPLDMERFFNHRMEEMMRGVFGGMGPGHPIFEAPPQLRPPQGGPEEEEDASAGSRDFMLKDGYVKRGGDQAGKWEDGEVSLGELDKMEPSRPAPQMPPVAPFRGLFSADPFFNGQAPSSPEIHTFSFGQSSSTSFVSRPDGSTEETKTTKDSQGNTKTTVKRCMGDKCQVFTTIKKSDGSEEKQESNTNMDEAEAEDFGRRWGMRSSGQPSLHGRRPSPRDEMLKRNEEQNSSLLSRFFGSDD